MGKKESTCRLSLVKGFEETRTAVMIGMGSFFWIVPRRFWVEGLGY